MKQNLIIRADADAHMGTGHIMRCIAFAQAWQDQGGDVTFLSYCDSEALRQRIIDEGFDLIPIEKPHPDPYDLSYTLDVLEQLKTQNSKLRTWFVLDGYYFTPDYQKAIKENGYRLLVVDDMAHLDHYHADILLNQNIHASSLHYACDRDIMKLLGCKYVLLRREFLKYKNWKREIPDKAKKILVTMGGSDPDNMTMKVIKALNNLDVPDLEVKIIVGPANPNIDVLKNVTLSAPYSMNVFKNVKNMPELMAWADVAISAGGSTCWEMAFMGVPILVIVLAENQKDIALELEKAGAAASIGEWKEEVSLGELKEVLKHFIHFPKRLMDMSKRGKTLIDGKGARRVVQAMSNVSIPGKEMASS